MFFDSGKYYCIVVLIISSFLFTLFSLSGIPICRILDLMGSKTVRFFLPFVFFFWRAILLYLADLSLKFYFTYHVFNF